MKPSEDIRWRAGELLSAQIMPSNHSILYAYINAILIYLDEHADDAKREAGSVAMSRAMENTGR